MFKMFKTKNVEKEIKEVINVEKIEVTVPKVVTVVANLRKDKAELEKTVAAMLVEAAADQKRLDEQDAILKSLLNEGGGSVGDVI